MATSPNYAWAEPDNSSLVKNGASDIRTLGDAIDTSVWNVGFGQAGKNKIINGDFAINQRNFTSTTTNGVFGFDRWALALSGATGTYSAQTFTPGTAPVAGYEASNFARLAITVGNDGARLQQFIEDVRTFAGQTATLSFWAKGTNPTTAGNLSVKFIQSFGTGGSPSANVDLATQTFVLTANWTRYSFTYAIPSIAGKTIGTTPNTSYLGLFIEQGTSVSTDPWTLDLWGVQVERGSKATPFQTASGGSPQAELAMCQRYYWRFTPTLAAQRFASGDCAGTTTAHLFVSFPVTMRTRPTALETSGTATDYSVASANVNTVCSAVPSFLTGSEVGASHILTVTAGLVLGYAALGRAVNTSGYYGWSAEL